MTTRKQKIPSFGSDEKEREFWSAHSVEEFAAELEDLDIDVKPARSAQIALRLYKDDLIALQEQARRRGIGHTTLARSILEQWLARAQQEAPPIVAKTANDSRAVQPNKTLQPTKPARRASRRPAGP